MPEHQRGRDPNRHQPQPPAERDLPPYHRAARYPDERSSETPYNQAQQALYETPCDLSTYRFFRVDRDQGWHVAVLGTPPPEQFQRRIEEILSTGEPVTLPEDHLIELYARRKHHMQGATWVERHYRPRRRTKR